MGYRGENQRDREALGPWRFSVRGALMFAAALALLAALMWAGWR